MTRAEIEHYLHAAEQVQLNGFDKGKRVTVTPEHMVDLARIALASLEAETVAYVIQDRYERQNDYPGHLSRSHVTKYVSDDDIQEHEITCTPLFAAPPAPVSVPDDYFSSLVAAARVRADKAMRKFPQPNYVLNKVAEESGEVIKAVIHFTEGREEWRNVEGEIIDNLAMLIRLVQEGDQVIGFTPPTHCRAAMLQSAESVTTAYKLPANTPCKEAPEHIWLQTAGVWPENGEFSELTWCSDNQHQDDTLYVRADIVSGNSPVIPDGWVKCSERMPEKDGKYLVASSFGIVTAWFDPAWSNKFQDCDTNCDEGMEDFEGKIFIVTHWQPLPAAPQQEE
ncbi:hypothetical protein GTGU_00145 [Trabulsiella guamensis ATCC 49490]|uniref:DUF551 domain-containing protein n=1 Tax=Trabulsiella guamensis ATCC 49490 TaxID=1005994 RepID=A0A085ASF4_9ENTR|nr:DUF551 domain-containing protein [Trabulsiella guamensis]KFC13149.1 hypothetical protein GTGU_00145 [Trabulsiella guamensis ATCC 49490]